MENRYGDLIEKFESNIRRLIDERNTLLEENRELQTRLGIKDEDLRQAHKEILDLRNEYMLLETAGGISGSDDDESREKSRNHLNKLVREIDKCLALLKQ